METVPFQQELRPALTHVYGGSDYRNFRALLIKIDTILINSGLEQKLIGQALASESPQVKKFNDASSAYGHLRHALRCNIARHLVGESYRAFSLRISDSTLFQWFIGTGDYGSHKGISKSALERYEKYFDEGEVKSGIQNFLSELSCAPQSKAIGLEAELDFKKTWMDSTCVKSNIHFPADWVLLRDGVRSLLLAIKTIRRQGLKHRMQSPADLLKRMNKLCIEMTHTRRKKDSKKRRKQILRSLKKLSHCISKHAERYRDLLEKRWQDSSWSEAQKNQVICRIKNILDQLPEAMRQAHERIIGGRQIKSDEKILSLYDKNVEVIVRGKAGGEVEFGHRLLLVEQEDGLLINWNLFSKGKYSDSDNLQPTVKELQNIFGKLESVSADRAFGSKNNEAFLEKEKIANAICPKSPTQLQEKLRDPIFLKLQTRRSQTEGRIGIFKNVFLGRPLRSRILANKRHAINWCVLSHNLWVLSRKIVSEERSAVAQAA